jgi:putative oxidoreductase
VDACLLALKHREVFKEVSHMAIHSVTVASEAYSHPDEAEHGSLRYVVPVARVLFAAIFVISGPNHFSPHTIEHAVSHGVPLASVAVPLSGLIALVGGLSVALGYKTRIGAWLLVLFLIPVTLMMHNFWTFADPTAAAMQQTMFVKNLALIGGALMIAYFGAGPVSLDAHDVFPRRRSAHSHV